MSGSSNPSRFRNANNDYDSSDNVYRVPNAGYIYICLWPASQGGVDCVRDYQ